MTLVAIWKLNRNLRLCCLKAGKSIQIFQLISVFSVSI